MARANDAADLQQRLRAEARGVSVLETLLEEDEPATAPPAPIPGLTLTQSFAGTSSLGFPISGVNVLAGASANNIPAGLVGATVAGGGLIRQDVTGRSQPNVVLANFGAISGGYGNTASGVGGVVPGGAGNFAGGDYSFAAGQNAKALYNNSFVWNDGSNGGFASSANGQFLLNATGGVGINTNNPGGFALNVNGGVNAASFNASGALTAGSLSTPGALTAGAITASSLTTGGALTAGSLGTTGAITAGSLTASGAVNAGSLALSGGASLRGDIATDGGLEIDRLNQSDGSFGGATRLLRFGDASSGEGIVSQRVGNTLNGHFGLTFYTSNQQRMSVYNDGSVAIGAYTGPYNTGPNDQNPHLLFVAGSMLANKYDQFSDARYKRNISTLDNALDTVLNLRGVNYDWNRDDWKDRNFPKGRQVGFIAQEMEKVLPELVSTDGNGYKSVSYANVTPVLVEAIKALNAKLDAKQKQIDELLKIKEENTALKNQIAELAKLIQQVKAAQEAPRPAPSR